MKRKYPDWLRKAARKGGKAKSEAKTAANKLNAAKRWRNHVKKPIRMKPASMGRLKRAANGKSVGEYLEGVYK